MGYGKRWASIPRSRQTSGHFWIEPGVSASASVEEEPGESGKRAEATSPSTARGRWRYSSVCWASCDSINDLQGSVFG